MQKDSGFDFDRWAILARQDPAAFERHRRVEIVRLLRSVPIGRRRRLRGLQWRIDQVRRTSGTPLAACIRISQMMWESVQGEHGLVAALQQARDPAPPVARAKAPVLPFGGRNNTN